MEETWDPEETDSLDRVQRQVSQRIKGAGVCVGGCCWRRDERVLAFMAPLSRGWGWGDLQTAPKHMKTMRNGAGRGPLHRPVHAGAWMP